MDNARRILALETSGRQGSVALLTDNGNVARVIGQVILGDKERTAQVLAPAMKKLLASAGCSPKSIELVAVTIGPGSFTGLRIGVTTAKAFAYSVGAEVVAVNTLDVLAAQAPTAPEPVWAILDAQRQELFAACYAAETEDSINTIHKTKIIPQDAWLASLQAADRVTGLALKRLAARLPAGVVAMPEDLWQPLAATVGQLAWRAYQSGQRDDLWKLAPNYYRASAAEEKVARP